MIVAKFRKEYIETVLDKAKVNKAAIINGQTL